MLPIRHKKFAENIQQDMINLLLAKTLLIGLHHQVFIFVFLFMHATKNKSKRIPGFEFQVAVIDIASLRLMTDLSIWIADYKIISINHDE